MEQDPGVLDQAQANADAAGVAPWLDLVKNPPRLRWILWSRYIFNSKQKRIILHLSSVLKTHTCCCLSDVYDSSIEV
jgi:hypothetical protein